MQLKVAIFLTNSAQLKKGNLGATRITCGGVSWCVGSVLVETAGWSIEGAW